jgi:hypothetical protein
VVVPDFEKLCRTYLTALENAWAGSEAWRHRYDYLVIQIYDQAVRSRTGGELQTYLAQRELSEEPFIVEWSGPEAKAIIEMMRARRNGQGVEDGPRPKRRRVLDAIQSLLCGRLPGRERLLGWILGPEYSALQVGRFRLSGEPHQCLYDRYALSRMFMAAGFPAPEIVRPDQSRIPAWTGFCLDTEPDGTVYKPDSIWMEALRPE